MFLPLGFGGRFPRFPWVTTTLCLVIFLVHNIYGRMTMENVEMTYMESFRKILFSPTYSKAVEAFCETENLPKEIASETRELLVALGKKECGPSADIKQHFGKHVMAHADFHGTFVFKAVLPHPEFFGLEKEAAASILKIRSFQRKAGLFSNGNRGIFPLVMSQFLHADWVHLLGNLLVLFLVGCLVECRRSPLIMLGTFFVGGSLGFVLHAAFQKHDDLSYLVGASAGIAAVSGLFTAYFFRFRMRFMLFVVPPFYKTFHASSMVILPLTFYASDLLNSLSSGVDSGVAHVAHLGGSLFGLAVGLLFEKFRPIRWPLLYGFEESELALIAKETNPHERIHRSLDLLRVNPENMLASEIVCKETLRLIAQGFPVTPEFHELLRQHLPTLMSVYTRMKDPEKAFALLPKIPTQVGFPGILDRSSQGVIVAAMKWAQQKNDVWTLLRLYETWTKRFANAKRRGIVQDDVLKIIEALEQTPANYRYLSLLYHADARGPLANTYQKSLVTMYAAISESGLEEKEVA
ncbi:MAG: rhomboid family intramembrane serine protease [Bdellovibrionota bacterium]